MTKDVNVALMDIGTMNLARLDALATWLESGAPATGGVSGFDMEIFRHDFTDCGTICCIAGTTNIWFGDGAARDETHNEDAWRQARDLLGVDSEQAQSLFYCNTMHNAFPMKRITPDWAARCIRKLMQTGKVDWIGTDDAGIYKKWRAARFA